MVLMEIISGKILVNFINSGAHMLFQNNIQKKLNNCFLLICFAFSLFSCSTGAGTEARPSLGFSVDVYADDNCTEELIGIAASFRNDSLSAEPLESKISEIGCQIDFYLHDGDYNSVNLEDETQAQVNGSSSFYIVVNDSSLNGYKPEYETVKVTDFSNSPVKITLKKQTN